MEQKTWSVYRHTFPNGKVYIGISCEPEVRWDNGMGYAANQPMFRDIVRYGRENIKHEILFDGLTEDAAHEKERKLISGFGKNGREKTYNRQHADYKRPKPPEWYDFEVTRETTRKYMLNFRELSERWIDPYTKIIGVPPMYYRLETDAVKFDFFRISNEHRIHIWQCSIKYPRAHMTFKEIYDWLQTTPDMVIDTESEGDPIPDELLNSFSISQ